MGGRGQGRGGISGPQRGIKDDNSEVTFSNRTVTATENVVKALGEENLESMADYINGAIERVTGLDDFLTLNIVDGASGNTYAWMDWNGTMGINGKLFKNVDKLSQTYVEDVLAGFHPKGTDFNDVAVHEAGHFLDRKLTQMLGNQLQDWERASTPIVRTALDNLKARGDNRTYEQMQADLSGYGAQFYRGHTGNSFVETYAEAIADFGKNQDRANPLSREIVKLTREYLRKVQ